MEPVTADNQKLPRPENVTPEYMLEVLSQYYNLKWNGNPDTVRTVGMWTNFAIMVRMPDIKRDFTLMVNKGEVVDVGPGAPKEPNLLAIMLSDTMQRIYYDESTAAIETIGGRIKFRGSEREKRRMLAAVSFLTW